MTIKRNSKTGFKLLFEFWGRYHTLENFHRQWAKDHLKVVIVRRGDLLGSSFSPAEASYFVAEGLLARIEEEPHSGKRKIMSIAPPNMALMNTRHLHSHHLHPSKIIALRSGIIVTLSHKVLREFQVLEKSVDTLIDIFGNKEKRQLALLREATLGYPPFDRYLNFERLLPEIRAVTTQQEQADLLDISRNTVQQAQYFLATKKMPRK